MIQYHPMAIGKVATNARQMLLVIVRSPNKWHPPEFAGWAGQVGH